MKILFVNTDIGYGGAEKILVWLANQCADHGHEVVFFTYRDNCVMQPLNANVKHVHMQLENGGAEVSMFRTAIQMHKFIHKEKFDVGIAFLSPSILRLAISAIGTKIKLLFSHRADPYLQVQHKSLKLKVFGGLNKWAFNRADYYVFQTTMAQAYFNLDIQNHSTVIANPIHPLARTIERNGNIEKRIVTIGRLDLKQKRQDILIDAFNLISENYPEYVLEIYGSGEDEAIIKDMCKSNSRIKLMGKTDKVGIVIQNASVFVLSSDFEGIPNALLEALSIGVPCVATDCSPGGAAMLIDNNVNGLLVPRSNVKAMAQAISCMLDNPQKAETMAIEARNVNKTYSEKIISEKWMRVIENLTKQKA